MVKFKKKYCAILLSLVLTCQCCTRAFAQYEVMRAKTVLTDEQIEEQKQIEEMEAHQNMSTYNDYELPNFSQNSGVSSMFEKKIKTFFAKRKAKKNVQENKDNVENEDLQEENQNVSEKNPALYNQTQEEISDKNKFQINADKITYDDEDGNVYAKGNVEIISKAQDVKLRADDAVLEKPTQTIKLHGNVKVIKSGAEMTGESLIVDLNEQNILMDNPTLNAYSFTINAQEGYLISNDFQAINGTIKSNRAQEYVLETGSYAKYADVGNEIYGSYSKNVTQNLDKGKANRKQVYRVDAKEVVLTSYKDHNTLLLKKADIFYNNHKLIHKNDIEIIAGKDTQVFETSLPEIGNLRDFGTYIGYGFAFRLPEGQTLKLMPALTYGNSNIGVGVVGRYLTGNARIDAGYSTSTTRAVVRGLYKFNDNFRFRYGRSAFLPEGFYGSRKSGYAAQLEYVKSYRDEDMGIGFNHGVYAGFFSDYKKSHLEDAYATTRFRYMATLTKDVLKFENKEQDLSIKLLATAQGAATLYGSGQTQGVARIGPTIVSKVKHWESRVGYMLTGIHGDSPFFFDKYMYGKSTIMLNEKINFGDKFALGYRAFITPMKDNWQDKLLTESALYALFGPQDLKFVVSYDFVRSNANLNLMLILGTDSTKINFEKLITENLDSSKNKRDFYKNSKKNVDL